MRTNSFIIITLSLCLMCLMFLGQAGTCYAGSIPNNLLEQSNPKLVVTIKEKTVKAMTPQIFNWPAETELSRGKCELSEYEKDIFAADIKEILKVDFLPANLKENMVCIDKIIANRIPPHKKEKWVQYEKKGFFIRI